MAPTKSKNTELLNNLDKVMGEIVEYIDTSKLSSEQKKGLKALLANKKTMMTRVKSIVNGTKRKIPSNLVTDFMSELVDFLDRTGLKKFTKILKNSNESSHIKCSILYYIFLTSNAKKGDTFGLGLSNYLYNLTFATNKVGRPDGMFVDVHFIDAVKELYEEYNNLKTKYRVLRGNVVDEETVKNNSVQGSGTFYSMAILRDMQPVSIDKKLVGKSITKYDHLKDKDENLNGYILTKQALNSLIKAVLSMMRIMNLAVYTTFKRNGKKYEKVELINTKNPIIEYIKRLYTANVVIKTKRPGDDEYTDHNFREIFKMQEDGENIDTLSFVAGLTRVVKISNYFKNTFKVDEQEVRVPTLNALHKMATKKSPTKPRKQGVKITNVEKFYTLIKSEGGSDTIESIGDSIRVSNLMNAVALADKITHQLPITLYSESEE